MNAPAAVLTPDFHALRARFPLLSRRVHDDKPLVYLDNANTAQKPAEVFLQVAVDLLRDLGHAVFLHERKDGRLDRGESRVELENGPRFAADLILDIGFA